MGIFRKKQKDAEPEVPAETKLSDDSVWRVWADRGFDHIKDGDLPGAVENWCQAIDRFEDVPKFYNAFHERIFNEVSTLMAGCAFEGHVIPTHELAEIDEERLVKQPSIQHSLLSEDIFYFAKEKIGSTTTPEEATMLYISGAYSILGYLRFSTDLVESRDKCLEVEKLGSYSSEYIKTFGKHTYKGGLKPKYGIKFIGSIADFFGYIAEELSMTISEMGEEKVRELHEYRESHRQDRLSTLDAALQFAIHSTGAGHISGSRVKKNVSDKIGEYIADFTRMD